MKTDFKSELLETENLKNNPQILNEEYQKLKEYYIFLENEKIYDFIRLNPGLIVLLKKFKPCLTAYFPNGQYELEIDEDPEFDCTTLVLKIRVNNEQFNNGMMKKIDEINFSFVPLMQKMRLMNEILLIPDLKKNS